MVFRMTGLLTTSYRVHPPLATHLCVQRQMRTTCSFFQPVHNMSAKQNKLFTIPSATAATLASLANAHAQSSVTLYGNLDTGLAYVSNVGGNARYKATAGLIDGSYRGPAGIRRPGRRQGDPSTGARFFIRFIFHGATVPPGPRVRTEAGVCTMCSSRVRSGSENCSSVSLCLT
jgi:hypothetical protein